MVNNNDVCVDDAVLKIANDNLKRDIKMFNFIRYNNSDLCEIVDVVNDLSLCCNNVFVKDKFMKEENIEIKEAIAHTVTFFEKLGSKEILKVLKDILDNKYVAIYKTDDFLSEGPIYSIGNAVFEYNNPNCKIEITYHEDLESVHTLCHEFAHAIGHHLRHYKFNGYSSLLFSEVESLFMEILFLDYLESLGFNTHNERVSMMDCFRQNNELTQFRFTLQEYISILENYEYSLDQIDIDTISQVFDIDKEVLIDELIYPLEDFLPYDISMIVALKLYEIYQYDKRYALQLYFDITTSQLSDEELFIKLNDTKIFEHETQGFVKTLKK